MAKRSKEEALRIKREKERERRKRIREDPVKRLEQQQKEKEKYKRQREMKVKKSIDELTPRQKRARRKQWRINSKNYQQRKKGQKDIEKQMIEYTPPNSSDEENLPLSRRVIMGMRRANKNKVARYRQKKEMERKIQTLQEKLNRVTKRYERLKKRSELRRSTKILTPLTKTNLLIKEAGCSSNEPRVQNVKKRILFAEVIADQLKHTYKSCKKQKSKQVIKKLLSGDIIKKYGLKKYCSKKIQYKSLGSPEYQKDNILLYERKGKSATESKKIIRYFLKLDTNSIMAPGKKDFITRHKVTKQKRYLTDTMKNLHKKFLITYPEVKVSYAFFCRSRPFWIMNMKVGSRDTCMCTKHANFKLLIHSLFNCGVLGTKIIPEIIQKLCCDVENEDCLFRLCEKCRTKMYPYQKFISSRITKYSQWVTRKEEYSDNKTNERKICVKTLKTTIQTTVGALVKEFSSNINDFMAHQARIYHQYNAIRAVKKSLSEASVLVHCDFSENYSLKYSQETQSYHFGGSRPQVTLHTVVVYKKVGDSIKPFSYCTVSECLKHDVPAIWAHLLPILKDCLGNATTLHFLSDSPATQYRNKSMFSFLANNVRHYLPQVKNITWNYQEAGHGKGAPDGIGGVCKRTADRVVAQGNDIDSITTLLDVLKQNCPGILFSLIPQQEIDSVKAVIERSSIISFKGTMKVHQAVVNTMYPLVWFRSLSCFSCEKKCIHYDLGSLNYDRTTNSSSDSSIIQTRISSEKKLKYSNVYTDSEQETEVDNCSSLASKIKPGMYILVEICNESNSTTYRYVAVCQHELDEYGEVSVVFLKICDKKAKLFTLDEKDISDVNIDQIICTLPEPTMVCKGNRIYYSFPKSVDVFEK